MLTRRQRPRVHNVGNLRYAGNDQIRFHFDKSLVMPLWGRTSYEGNPIRYTCAYDGSSVLIFPVDDPQMDDEEARSVSYGNSTSFPLAHALWSLAPQGRAFEVHIENRDGARVGVITLDDVPQEFRYMRLEPGNPFRSPAAHVQAGIDEERRRRRTGGNAGMEPSVNVPAGNRRFRSIDSWAVKDVQGLPTREPVPSTVQTQVPNSPTVNQITLPSPRDFGFDFDTYEEWKADLQAELRKSTEQELMYTRVYNTMKNRLEGEKDEDGNRKA